jgi:hypothetical protein
MLIEFCIPHIFGLGANPKEVQFVRETLNSCVKELRAQGNARTWKPTIKRSGQFRVVFDLPNVFHIGSDPTDNARALQTLLHCLCDIDAAYLQFRNGKIPELYHSGVYYDRTDVWDSTPALYSRGFGDCKSLASTRIAELSVCYGVPCTPEFRFFQDEQKRTFYHIVLFTPEGRECPSKVLGMGQDENSYFRKTG